MFDLIISPAALRREARPMPAVAGLAHLSARAVAAVAALLAAAPAAADSDPQYTISRSTAVSNLNAASGTRVVYQSRNEFGAAALLPSSSQISPSYLGGSGSSWVEQLGFRNGATFFADAGTQNYLLPEDYASSYDPFGNQFTNLFFSQNGGESAFSQLHFATISYHSVENLYFDRAIGGTIVNDPAVADDFLARREVQDGYSPLDGDPIKVGNLFSYAAFSLWIYDLDTLNQYGWPDVAGALFFDTFVEFRSDVYYAADPLDRFYNAYGRVTDTRFTYSNVAGWNSADDSPGIVGTTYQYNPSPSTLDVEVEFLAGHRYLYSFNQYCQVEAYGTAVYGAGNEATCDALNSGYWNGKTDIRDLAGNPITLPAPTDGSFDLRLASPFSPAPAIDTPAAVPEPATWAMLVIGFGMVGASLRRRKARVISA